MGGLVADLLTLARAQRDPEALRLELVDLRDLVRPLAEGKGQTLKVQLGRSLLIQGDASKLRHAVSNLLDNAVSYTPTDGRVQVSGSREHDHVLVRVCDSGPGIAPEHLPHLFEPFYRVGRGGGVSGGHAGLGLGLAAWIVRAHGGQLTVSSRLGAGSAFTISLPAAA